MEALVILPNFAERSDGRLDWIRSVGVWISTGSGRLPVLFASFRFRQGRLLGEPLIDRWRPGLDILFSKPHI